MKRLLLRQGKYLKAAASGSDPVFKELIPLVIEKSVLAAPHPKDDAFLGTPDRRRQGLAQIQVCFS